MVRTDSSKGKSLREIKERDKAQKEKALREKCEAWAEGKFTKQTLVEWSNKNKGLWYLPVVDDEGEIEKCLVLRPIDRQVLSYASTKLEDDGLYSFLEAAMRECYIAGDVEIIDDDEYFIPASMKFNDIMKGKQAHLLKR